jgi:hypothetical protein
MKIIKNVHQTKKAKVVKGLVNLGLIDDCSDYETISNIADYLVLIDNDNPEDQEIQSRLMGTVGYLILLNDVSNYEMDND